MNNKLLLSRYDSIFGNGTSDRLISSQKYFNNKYIRTNISKISSIEIIKFLKENRIKFSQGFIENSFKIEKSHFNLSGSPESLLGFFYIQDLASQIPVNCIDFTLLPKNVKVLDMAASPGSKTTQIADLLIFNRINYEIIALEPEKKRVQKLINNIQKNNFENIKIINCRGEDFKSSEKYDIILLDAPCSGNLVGDRNWLSKRDIRGIEQNSKLQKKLLKNASSLLSKNGLLIYSTCSLEPEEDEENVDYAVKNLGLITVKPNLSLPFPTTPLSKFNGKEFDSNNSIRIMPYLSQTQGFFVACLKFKSHPNQKSTKL